MNWLLICFFFLLTVLVTSSFDEQDRLGALIDTIDEFNNSYYEKIYVHTNKEIYQPGDKIWFKAYLTGVANAASDSYVLYAQLKNDSSKVMSTRRYQIVDGKASGIFYLNNDLSNGKYSFSYFTEKSNHGGKPFLKKIHISDIQSLAQLENHELPSTYYISQNFDSLSIYEEEDSINLVLEKLQNGVNPVNVILTANGEIFWASEEDAGKQIKIALPLGDLPIGAATVAIIDHKGALLGENSLLINKDRTSEIEMILDKNEYLPEDSVSVDLAIKDYQGRPIQGNISVSVYLKELNFNPNRKSILSQMHQADYIPTIISGSITSTDNKDKYMIKGRVEEKQRRAEGIQVLAVDTQGEVFYDAITAEDGSFSIEVDSIHYPLTFFVRSSDHNQKKSNIVLDEQAYPTLESRSKKNKNLHVGSASNEEVAEIKKENSFSIKEYLDHQILEEIVVKDQRIEEIVMTDERIDEGSVNEVKLFNYFDNVKVESRKGEDLIKTGAFGGSDPNGGFLIMLRQVTQINYVQNGQIFLRGWKTVSPSPPLFVLNGMPLGNDHNSLNRVLPSMIKEIKVIRNLGSVAQFGARAQGGVVLVSTYDALPDFNEVAPTTGSTSKVALSNYYEQPSKKFYPSQSDNKKVESCAYWNDNISVDESGKFSFQFKNLPFNGTMIIKVEGVDEHRNFMSYETNFTIK
jgi:hypothetical protein